MRISDWSSDVCSSDLSGSTKARSTAAARSARPASRRPTRSASCAGTSSSNAPMRRLAALLTTVAEAGLSACGSLPMDTTPAAMRHAGFVQREVVVDGRSHRYQVFVPAAASAAKPPVILFLHGSGERGDDGIKPTLAGLGPHVRANAGSFPAIVVFPQAPENGEWRGANAGDRKSTRLNSRH